MRWNAVASETLSGLHRIDELYDQPVEDEPGVYLFYKTLNGPVRYVGRADTKLRRRIAYRGYTYFRYKHIYDETEAYHWECVYFHRFEDTIENINHPARPWGYDELECPCCSPEG